MAEEVLASPDTVTVAAGNRLRVRQRCMELAVVLLIEAVLLCKLDQILGSNIALCIVEVNIAEHEAVREYSNHVVRYLICCEAVTGVDLNVPNLVLIRDREYVAFCCALLVQDVDNQVDTLSCALDAGQDDIDNVSLTQSIFYIRISSLCLFICARRDGCIDAHAVLVETDLTVVAVSLNVGIRHRGVLICNAGLRIGEAGAHILEQLAGLISRTGMDNVVLGMVARNILGTCNNRAAVVSPITSYNGTSTCKGRGDGGQRHQRGHDHCCSLLFHKSFPLLSPFDEIPQAVNI